MAQEWLLPSPLGNMLSAFEVEETAEQASQHNLRSCSGPGGVLRTHTWQGLKACHARRVRGVSIEASSSSQKALCDGGCC